MPSELSPPTLIVSWAPSSQTHHDLALAVMIPQGDSNESSTVGNDAKVPVTSQRSRRPDVPMSSPRPIRSPCPGVLKELTKCRIAVCQTQTCPFLVIVSGKGPCPDEVRRTQSFSLQASLPPHVSQSFELVGQARLEDRRFLAVLEPRISSVVQLANDLPF
jgi:hypothetical protein